MASLIKRPGRLAARRAFPPLTAIDLMRVARSQWKSNLSLVQRRRARKLLLTSRGWPGNFTARERRQLRKIVKDYGLFELGRHAVVTFVTGRVIKGKPGSR